LKNNTTNKKAKRKTMALRGIFGIDLDKPVGAACFNSEEHVFGFLRDKQLKVVKISVENVRNFGDSKVVDFSFEHDVAFVKQLSYEHNEIKMIVDGDTVFKNDDHEKKTHIFHNMTIDANNANRKVIKDVEIKNAVKKNSNHMFYVWD